MPRPSGAGPFRRAHGRAVTAVAAGSLIAVQLSGPWWPLISLAAPGAVLAAVATVGRRAFRSGPRTPTVVVGGAAGVAGLVGRIRDGDLGSLDVCGACVPRGQLGGTRLPGALPVLGDLGDVADAVARVGAGAVVLAPGAEAAGVRPAEVAAQLANTRVQLFAAADALEPAARRGPRTGTGEDGLDGHRWQRRTKALLDRILAGLALLVLLPVIAGAALAVRLTGPGPLLTRRRRIGQWGVEFDLLAFRTTVADAGPGGEGGTVAGGVRVTVVGRLLRRTSLAELPQLLNVLRGKLSLVGPLPLPPSDRALRQPAGRRRLRAKPGITGPVQVASREGLGPAEALDLEASYVDSWSLGADVTILLRSLRSIRGTSSGDA